MYLLWFLLLGAAAGAFARLIVPGPQPGRWMMSITVGILGSFVGGLLARIGDTHDQGQLAALAMSAVGAVVLLLAYHTVQGHAARA